MLLTNEKVINTLSLNSKYKLNIKCDYCHVIFSKEYRRYLESRIESDIKDSCKKCIKLRNIERFLIKIKSSQVNDIIDLLVRSQKYDVSGVYSINNKNNNKAYIGSSKNIISRWKNHITEMKDSSHHCKDFNETDLSELDFIILDTIEDIDSLVENEYNYINLFNTNNDEYGYNKMSKFRKSIKKDKYSLSLNEKLKRSKLDFDEICDIKLSISKGISLKNISEKFNVNYATVHSIKSCSIWADVLPDLNPIIKNMEYKGVRKGVNNSCSKLTEIQVREIKVLISEGKMTMTDIGKKFNVSRTLISHIKNNKLWSHIK